MSASSIQKRIAARKRRNERRLDKDRFPTEEGPLLRASNIHYELADRTLATNYGGIGLMHRLVRELGLAEEVDRRLHVLVAMAKLDRGRADSRAVRLSAWSRPSTIPSRAT